MKFMGTLAQLRAMMVENGIDGHWEEEPSATLHECEIVQHTEKLELKVARN